MSTTIYDVAQYAGVAISTVSKVLSGRHSVSKRTRERVLHAITELNYIPSSAARSLAGDRTNMLGIVIAYDPDHLFSDPMLLKVIHGIDDRATEEDYALILSTPRTIDERMRAFNRLLRGFRPDGVLVEGGLGDEGVTLLADSGYPCVVIGYNTHTLPCVYPDDYRGAQLMTRHLVELGHKRIGVISGPRSNPLAMQARFRGYIDELKAADLEFDSDLLLYGNFRPESGFEAAAKLMALQAPPTAIFAFNDRMAMGALRWLREQGYKVPEQVSVAGFDNVADSLHTDPPLTTIHFSATDIGRTAADMLFRLIDSQQLEANEIVLPVEFIGRASTGSVA